MTKESENSEKDAEKTAAAEIVETDPLSSENVSEADFEEIGEPFYKTVWRRLPDHQGWLEDLKICAGVLTRIPLPPSALPEEISVSDASRFFPIIGGVIGLIGGIVMMFAAWLSFSPMIVAIFGLLTMAVVTGALHEDGLADTIDGLGGGQTRERKLAIMHDSQIGSFGVVALIFSFAVRWAALSAIAGMGAGQAALAVIAAGAASRALLPAVMHYVPVAREDGLSADAGRPGFDRAGVAFIIGVLFLLFCLGFQTGIVSLGLVVLAAAMFVYFVANRIGGQTGDVLGATQQISEAVVLLAIVMVEI